MFPRTDSNPVDKKNDNEIHVLVIMDAVYLFVVWCESVLPISGHMT